MKISNLLIVFLLSCLFLAGCSKEAKKSEEGTEAGVPAPPKTDQFPKDIPIYPYQQQLKTQSAQRAARADFQTSSDVEAIVSFYQEKLPEQKWTKIGDTEKDGKKMLTYKKEHQILHVTLEVDAESQLAHVTLLLNR